MGGEVPHFLKYSSFLPHKNTNAILYVFNHLAHLALNGHSMVTGSRVTVRHRRSLKVTPEATHRLRLRAGRVSVWRKAKEMAPKDLTAVRQQTEEILQCLLNDHDAGVQTRMFMDVETDGPDGTFTSS